MENDDRPVGRLLTRREALALLGAAGAALLAACANVTLPPTASTPAQANPTDAPATAAPSATTAPTADVPPTAAEAASATPPPTQTSIPPVSCVVRPELTEGPYFVDEQLDRSDIRSEPSDGAVKAGLPLALAIHVTRLEDSACVPLAGAQVDVWHCDAQGVYSGVNGAQTSFLRGYQRTGEDGLAQFITIYPGWYPGRAVHIHFKIRAASEAGAAYEFTSQFFFDDAVTDQVYSQALYAARGERNVRNAQDGIYRSGGDQLLLPLTATDEGYASVFNIALDLSDAQAGQPDGFRGG